MNCFTVHSCDAQAKDCMHISYVFGFDGAIFIIGGMPGHGLCLACSDGFKDFALGETLIMLANGLNHGHSGRGAHIKVGETTSDALGLAMKDDFFAIEVGDNLLATGLVADGETVLLQLGEGEKIGNFVLQEPLKNKFGISIQ
jgi:hypothetical protein